MRDKSKGLTGRVPPHDRVLEQATLGNVMGLGESGAGVLVDNLEQTDFYSADHRKVYAAIKILFDGNEPIDLISVVGALRKSGDLEDVGGAAYVTRLHEHDPIGTAGQLKKYCAQVRRFAMLREAVVLGTELYRRGFDEGTEPLAMIEDVQEKLYRLATRGESGGPVKLSDAIVAALPDIEESVKGDREIGLTTGFPTLDRILLGLRRGELIVLAGKTSKGKTSLAMDFIDNAILDGRAALIFSLEMTARELVARLLSKRSGVEIRIIRYMADRQEAYQQVIKATAAAEDDRFWIDDTGSLSVAQMRARAKAVQRKHGLDFIVVDYLQLVRAARPRENSEERTHQIVKDTKALAKELDVPVLILSQFNRAVEESREPGIKHLKGSGGIEQTADVVLLLHKPKEDRPETKLIVAKQRNGPLGHVRLIFRNKLTTFVEEVVTGRRESQKGEG